MAQGSEIDRTESLIRQARELREKLWADPHRPRYHFLPPAGWMNDINGALFWKGRYHIFYQCNPDAAYWNTMRWGHASSLDLVHWVHHPIALEPTPGGPDRDGCFSGVAVIHGGVPTLVYHGVPEGTCLATSADDDLTRWTKSPANPVVRVPQPREAEYGKYIVYDPCAWEDGGTWYLLSGGTLPEGRDTGYLFRSKDLLTWEYRHPFYQPNPEWTELGEDCAVPNFFPLGNKHVLLFVSHKYGCQYYVGRYDNERFEPERHGRMNWAGGQLIAPMTMLDGKGRRLMLGWVCEARRSEPTRAAGWAGVMTLPRVLSLGAEGDLRIEPAAELEVLRQNHRHRQNLRLNADSELVLDDVSGDGLELAVEFAAQKPGVCGVIVRRAPDGTEQTVVSYDRASGALSVDTTRSSLSADVVQPWPCPWGTMYPDPLETRVLPFHQEPSVISDVRVQTAPLQLARGEPLRLRLFLDRSVLEVFANGRQCLTQRIYPSRPDSQGVALFARGKTATVRRLDAWDMAPAGM